MIVKYDEYELLDKCLASAREAVDDIYLWINYPKNFKLKDKDLKKVTDVADKYKAIYEVNEWTNFGDARNKSFAMAGDKYDFLTWLDTDDELINPEKLNQVAAATPSNVSGVYMAYDYAHDEFGNVTVQHYVARLVRNNGTYAWSNKILHETLEPIRQCDKAVNNEVSVYHHADEERRDESLMRNIKMLEKELRGEGDDPDPRTLFYLGSAYIDAGNTDTSKVMLLQYLQSSGWAEERAQAWVSLGNIFSDEDNIEEARRCFIHAVAENPKDPSPYVALGKIEMLSEIWDKAIEWLEMALEKKPGPMSTVNFSVETKYRAYMYLADCYLNLGGKNIDKALKTAQKALKLRPDATTQKYYDTIYELTKQRDMTQGVLLALRELQKQKNATSIEQFLATLPESLQANPAILQFKRFHAKPTTWHDKSMVIFVGDSVLGDWGPWSLKEGIGGSEEAVVRLGNELTKLGWEVTVFSTPGKRAGTYDGVHYRNYWEFNLSDTFNAFVAWRNPWFFDAKVKAKSRYLWLHDVMPPEEFTKERLANLDKVIVLSKYHRSLFPMIPDEKIFLSANGITPEEFENPKYTRDYQRVIYMSSHVRGLQLLYEIWPEVKQAVPEAKLDIYYGWGSYDAVNKANPERMQWKQKMIDWEKRLPDVTDHGKIGQDQIVEEIQKSGVWAYPCPFPEIFCITALKAQAGGAIPVSSSFAALDETVNFGTKIPMKENKKGVSFGEWDEKELKQFKDALIKELKNPTSEADRQKMMQATRDRWSWKNVAESWIKEMS